MTFGIASIAPAFQALVCFVSHTVLSADDDGVTTRTRHSISFNCGADFHHVQLDLTTVCIRLHIVPRYIRTLGVEPGAVRFPCVDLLISVNDTL